jgi:acyl-CoA synthetase (NDP forming)
MPVHGPLSPGLKRCDLGLFSASFYKKQPKRVKNGRNGAFISRVSAEIALKGALFLGKNCSQNIPARIS